MEVDNRGKFGMDREIVKIPLNSFSMVFFV